MKWNNNSHHSATSILTQTKCITNYEYVNKAKNVCMNTRLNNNLGRPVATFRRDNGRDIDFKNLTVREIEFQSKQEG